MANSIICSGQRRHQTHVIFFKCIPSRNKAWIAAASSARLKFSAFRQLIMERWCGIVIENLRYCQKAGTFRSFEERSGSDAFILFLPSIQECVQRPPSRPQNLQSTSFRSKVQSVDHISLFIALGRWRVADRALRSSPFSTRSSSNELFSKEREVQSASTGLKLFLNVCMLQYCSH